MGSTKNASIYESKSCELNNFWGIILETNIFMVRHAESPFLFGRERTRGLSVEGAMEALKVAEILAAEKVDVVVSSPFERAIKSVEPIAAARNLKIELFEELRERMIKGDYQLPWEEIERAIEQSYMDKNYCLPDGETTKQAAERSVPIIKRIMKNYEGKNIVVGTHGNIMTIIMNDFDERYGFEFWKSTSKPDIYKLCFLNGQLKEVSRLWEASE